MAVFTVVLDLLAHTLGLLNLFLLALLFVRDRDSLYLREFLLMFSFSLIVVYQSMGAVMGDGLPRWVEQVGGAVAMAGVCGMIFALPWYVNQLEPVGKRHVDERIFAGLGVLALIAVVVGAGGLWLGGPDWTGVEACINFWVMALCSAVIAYTIILALAAAVSLRLKPTGGTSQNGGMNETTRMAMHMGLLTLVIMPVLLWLDFWGNDWPGMEHFRVLPGEYLLWSCLLMNLRIKTILAVPCGTGAFDAQAVEGFCRDQDISPREQEVLDLLVKGRTYEEIADLLCISLSTVKTHVSRLYRKTGVSNKVELMHRLQGTSSAAKTT